MLRSGTQRRPLALLYCQADKLLDALPILLLSGAAAVVLTWLTQRRLGFSHLLVHPRQTQPGGEERNTQEGEQEMRTGAWGAIIGGAPDRKR